MQASVLFFDPNEQPATNAEALGVRLPTNLHFTLKMNGLQRAGLNEFTVCYRSENDEDVITQWNPGQNLQAPEN